VLGKIELKPVWTALGLHGPIWCLSEKQSDGTADQEPGPLPESLFVGHCSSNGASGDVYN
jgi:hypothetical protein